MQEKLNIQSIFTSIDGEVNGYNNAGQISTFIRLKKCNLSCSWCDTKYAQNREPVNLMTINQILEKVKTRKVTITGGEPLLQAKGVAALIDALNYEKYLITIETNGSMCVDWLHMRGNIRYIVDYKLPSSGMEAHMNMRLFPRLTKKDWVKFVIADWKDYSKACYIRTNLRQVGCEAQFAFSPIRIAGSVNYSFAAKVAERMIEENLYDVHFSLQLHKILWPNISEGEEH